MNAYHDIRRDDRFMSPVPPDRLQRGMVVGLAFLFSLIASASAAAIVLGAPALLGGPTRNADWSLLAP